MASIPTSAPGVIIRQAAVADAALLSSIAARTFTETFGHMYSTADLESYLATAYALDRMEEDLKNPDKVAFLVEQDGQVIGYTQAGCCGLPHPAATAACGEIKRFYLVKGKQGLGIGKDLFQAVEAWLLREGPRNVWIGVWSENYGAQRFYQRFGYGKVGEYGFPVGDTVDREWILCKPAVGGAPIPYVVDKSAEGAKQPATGPTGVAGGAAAEGAEGGAGAVQGSA